MGRDLFTETNDAASITSRSIFGDVDLPYPIQPFSRPLLLNSVRNDSTGVAFGPGILTFSPEVGMTITPFSLASRFIGVKEGPGTLNNPMITAMLNLDYTTVRFGDETPWCSAFVNYITWLCRLPRSKSLAARSWLTVGRPVLQPEVGDIVILTRGEGEQPGPDVVDAPGHVGFYAGGNTTHVEVLGGNQDNMVSVKAFPRERILSIRRLT